MRITQETIAGSAGNIYRLAPEGRLDAVTVPSFETVLQDHLDTGHVQVIVDMAQVTYLSSSGLRALLRARRQAQAGGGDLILCSMSPRVREIFEMIGFMSLFGVYERVDEAVASFARTTAT